VDHNSDGHDDIIIPIAIKKHSSDGHDDIITPIGTVVFLFQCVG
jgi:hypothetical protein